MILGKDLILALNGTPMAAAKSCGLNVQQEFIDVCSPTEARVKRKVPTTYDWSMDSDCLIAETSYAQQLIDMVTNGTELGVQFYDLQLGIYRHGYAFVSSCKITASTGSLAKMSISLVGSGALNKTNWDNIAYTLGERSDNVDVVSTDGMNISPLVYNYSLYIAIKQNNQFIRYDDGRISDDLSASIDDDTFTRYAHFKGGLMELYLVYGLLSGSVITNATYCKIAIPSIWPFPNTWFKIGLSAYCDDIGGHLGDTVYIRDIEFQRSND